MLDACGRIDQRVSGGNWVAVHFDNQYSAEKALSINGTFSTTSNTYFGVSRLSPERLRVLQQYKSKLGSALEGNQQHPLLLAITDGSSKPLEENDVLMQDVKAAKRPSHPENICQRVMAWYFGWTYPSDADDDTPEHLKLD